MYDGINDAISVADSDSISFTSDLTVSAWVKTNLTANMNILSKGTAFRWEVSSTKNQVQFLIYESGRETISSGVYLEIDTRYHLGVKLDFSSQEAFFYKNGVLMTKKVITKAFINDTANDLYIGHLASPSGYWDGIIDDVRIYNKVLSDDEILLMSESFSVDLRTLDDLVAWWKLDDTQWLWKYRHTSR